MTTGRVAEFLDCPFQQFLQHMTDTGSSEWVWSYVEMCSRFGVFHSSPTATLLARPVNSAIGEADLSQFNDLDPDHELASSGLTAAHDTWHILYGHGDPSFFFSLCPYPLESVSWHRNKGSDRLRTHNFQRLQARYGIKTQSDTQG